MMEKGLVFTLLFVLVVGFITMPAEQITGDAMSVRCESYEIIHHGRFGVTEEIATKTPGIQPGQYYFYSEKRHAWYPKFGFLNTVIYLPVMGLKMLLDEYLPSHRADLVFLLNIHNLLLSIGCTWMFYILVALFSLNQLVRSAYTLCIIYTTFCWNHFRAQSFEIHQMLFYALALYFGIRAIRHRTQTGSEKADMRFNPNSEVERSDLMQSPAREGVLSALTVSQDTPPHFRNSYRPAPSANSSPSPSPSEFGLKRDLLFTSLFLSALILVKSVFVLLVPIFAVTLIFPDIIKKKRSFTELRPVLMAWICWFCLPVVLAILALLTLNDIRFASPFSTGYTQWAQERNLFSGNLMDGVWGLLFSTQFGVFSCFPPLLLSLFYWAPFFRRFRIESSLIVWAALVLLLINAKFINWAGDMCYGPRYLLPVLPSLALPFAWMIGDFITKPFSFPKWGFAAVIITFLGSSLYLQVMVSKYPFFCWYGLHDKLSKSCIDYLDNRPRGLIFADVDALHRGDHPFPPFKTIQPRPTQLDIRQADAFIIRNTPLNYFWFR